VLAASLACWMTFGRLHSFHDADSLLPVMVSLERWTPFFWGQDRFGMLVPLLAMPLRNPLTNLLFQGWATTTAALLAPFFVARYFGASRYWFAAGALADALFLLVVSPSIQFDWLVRQPYGLSMSLAFGALLLAERPSRWRRAAAVALFSLACWVNLAIAPFMLLCIAARPIATWPRELSIASVGLAVGGLARRLATAPPTTTDFAAPAVWPEAWRHLAQNSFAELAHPLALVAVIVVAASATARLLASGRVGEWSRGALAALIVAAVYALAVGTLEHVRLNDYFARYVYPSQLLAAVAMAFPIVWMVRRPLHAAALGTAACAIITIAVYGAPSMKRLNRTIDEQMGSYSADVLAARATVIAGDYWTVWPAVFHANLTSYRNGTFVTVYGLTYRSEPTNALWSGATRARGVVVAAARSDETVNPWLSRLNVPIAFLGYRRSLALFAVGHR
jgi:hypothetical protein